MEIFEIQINRFEYPCFRKSCNVFTLTTLLLVCEFSLCYRFVIWNWMFSRFPAIACIRRNCWHTYFSITTHLSNNIDANIIATKSVLHYYFTISSLSITSSHCNYAITVRWVLWIIITNFPEFFSADIFHYSFFLDIIRKFRGFNSLQKPWFVYNYK